MLSSREEPAWDGMGDETDTALASWDLQAAALDALVQVKKKRKREKVDKVDKVKRWKLTKLTKSKSDEVNKVNKIKTNRSVN